MSPLADVRRVAVRLLSPAGVVAADWLGHGQEVAEAVAALSGADGPTPTLARAVATVREVPELGVRLHQLNLDHLDPHGVGDGPAGAPVGADRTLDAARLAASLRAWVDGGRRDPLGGQRGSDLVRVQRAGVYALVGDRRRLLACRLARTGRWTLPGGGIDPDEQPDAALARELHEETGLELAQARLIGVPTAHWTGRAPDGVVEDFHAVQLLYRAEVLPGEPRVVEVGGSTVEAAWFTVEELLGLPITYVVRSGIEALGG